ncbi:MAG TPA: glycoside hydrolase family 25 protein [Chloroflexota bacterium]|nr:glycoside hydrolase family 25 protein [Chloroflexota bacterium]
MSSLARRPSEVPSPDARPQVGVADTGNAHHPLTPLRQLDGPRRLTAAESASRVLLMPLFGHDISAHQRDFDIVADRHRHSFLGLKQTEGLTWPDQEDEGKARLLRRYRAMAGEAAYDLVILYHFARPQPGRTGRQEADHFIRFVGDLKPWETVALDLESNHGLSGEGVEDFAIAFVDRIEERYPSLRGKVLLYSFPGFLKGLRTNRLVQRCPVLWVAHYFPDGTTNHNPSLDRWPAYTFWQFTERPLDRNIFNGSIEELRALGAGGRLAPTPTPTPTPTKDSDMFMFWHKGVVYLARPPWRSRDGLHGSTVDALKAIGMPLAGKDSDDSQLHGLLSPDAR